MIKFCALLALLACSNLALLSDEDCQAACPRNSDNTQLWCGTDGIPFNNLCKAQCRNPTNQAVFICNNTYLSTPTLCMPKCQKNLACRNQFASVATEYVCGSDALIYRNDSERQCNGVYSAGTIGGNTQAFLDECLNRVILQFGQPAGAAPIIKPSK